MKRRDYLKLGGIGVVATASGCVSSQSTNIFSDTKTVSYNRQLQVKLETDVFIAGGGPAGVAAAVAASESGAKVFLAEAHSCLGGMGTAGALPTFMQVTDGVNYLCGGFGKRLLDRYFAKRTMRGEALHHESLKRIYDDFMLGSGAKFHFYTKMIDVQASNGKIDYVVCSTPAEVYAVRAKVYIDATGNGDLAVMAGAKYEKGGGNGLMPGSLCSTWGGIDWKTWNEAKPKNNHQPQGYRLEEAYKDGVFSVKDLHMTGIFKLGDDNGVGNIGHVFNLDGTDAESITKGLIDGRKSMVEYERYLKNYLKGFEKAHLLATGSLLGVRETRRIIGEYVLNIEDYKKRASFDDEIGRYCYPIDIHPSDADAESYKRHREEFDKLYRYKKGENYGIPYRILTPQGFDNLLVAGRCVSSDQLVHGSIRVMPACFIMGQAAGIAASMSAKEKVSTRKIDVKVLQKKLKDYGAFLPNYNV